MKILLTGKPGSGKLTVIAKFIDSYADTAIWAKTEEIRSAEGARTGFRGINSNGNSEVISHKFDIESQSLIGANRVDLPTIDKVFTSILLAARKDVLVILDEIGPIQLLSNNFVTALDRLFKSGQNILATIHFRDEQAGKYREKNDVILVEINDSNRDFLPTVLCDIFENNDKLKELSKGQQAEVMKMLKTYIYEEKLIEGRKLFRNALKYVVENRVTSATVNMFDVKGNHGSYGVTRIAEDYKCECDLFLGKGKYLIPGECSHIQAVKLLEMK